MKNDKNNIDYQIISIHEDFALVLGLSYESPLTKLTAIGEDLKLKQYKGKVVFDLLLSNGKSDNRFIVLDFDERGFIRESVKVLSTVKPWLTEESKKYIKKNKEILKRGVLTDHERFTILSS